MRTTARGSLLLLSLLVLVALLLGASADESDASVTPSEHSPPLVEAAATAAPAAPAAAASTSEPAATTVESAAPVSATPVTKRSSKKSATANKKESTSGTSPAAAAAGAASDASGDEQASLARRQFSVDAHMLADELTNESMLHAFDLRVQNRTAKRFKNKSLAFVQPSVPKSVEFATSRYGCKFDFLSPRWYSVRRDADGAFHIDGADKSGDDDKRDFLSDAAVSCASRAPRVLPAVSFDAAAAHEIADELFAVAGSEGARLRLRSLAANLRELARAIGFSGYVLQLGTLLDNSVVGAGVAEFAEALKTGAVDGQAIRASNSTSPTASTDPLETVVLSLSVGYRTPVQEHARVLQSMSAFVDHVIVDPMIFSTEGNGPQYPLYWIRSALDQLSALSGVLYDVNSHTAGAPHGSDTVVSTKRADLRAKFMLGISFSGWEYIGGVRRPVSAQDLREFLEQPNIPLIQYDTAAAEHSFMSRNASVRGRHWMYYPTYQALSDRLKFLESDGYGVAITEMEAGIEGFFALL